MILSFNFQTVYVFRIHLPHRLVVFCNHEFVKWQQWRRIERNREVADLPEKKENMELELTEFNWRGVQR